MNGSRYDGKPLLRLLECYVLQAIGHLTEEQASTLASMQGKLAHVYGVNGSWDSIVATVMSFPESMPESIRDNWRKNQTIAAKAHVHLSPQQFSEMFVDQNFVP